MDNKQQTNIAAYRTEEALAKYSNYFLYPNERYLINKYFSKDKNVLDLACGGGRTTLPLHEMGFTCKGVDLSDTLINAAAKRFPYINFEQGDYCDLQEPDQSYSQVLLSHNGLDYAHPEENRIKAIKEIYRVLKPGGVFIFSSHNINSLHFSPYYFVNYKRLGWKLKNTLTAFQEKAYVLDLNMYAFFATNQYIIKQMERERFSLLELVGFRMSKNSFFTNFISPYNHFVFRKA